MSRTASLLLIVFALLFSHFLLVYFNLSGGLEVKEIKFQYHPWFAIAVYSSTHKQLSTALVGYLLFALFLFANFKNGRTAAPKMFYTTLTFCLLSIVFEVFGYLCDYYNNYTGQYIRIGLFLFLMCFSISNSIQKK